MYLRLFAMIQIISIYGILKIPYLRFK